MEHADSEDNKVIKLQPGITSILNFCGSNMDPSLWGKHPLYSTL